MKRISSTLASRGLGLYVLLPLQFCRKKILIRLEKEKFHFFPKKKKKTLLKIKVSVCSMLKNSVLYSYYLER